MFPNVLVKISQEHSMIHKTLKSIKNKKKLVLDFASQEIKFQFYIYKKCIKKKIFF